MVLADGTYDGKQIVDPKALLPAVTPQIVSSPASEPAMRSGFYGYGFNVGTTSAARMELSHSGAFELGAGTNFVILPSADVAIVALTNATPARLPRNADRRIRRPGAVRRGARGLVQALHRRVRADGRTAGLAGRPAAARESRAPPRRCRPMSAPTTTTTGARRGSPRRTASCNSRSAPKLDVPLNHWDGNVFTFCLGHRKLAARNDFQGDVRRRQADARVLRRHGQGDIHPMTARLLLLGTACPTPRSRSGSPTARPTTCRPARRAPSPTSSGPTSSPASTRSSACCWSSCCRPAR